MFRGKYEVIIHKCHIIMIHITSTMTLAYISTDIVDAFVQAILWMLINIF